MTLQLHCGICLVFSMVFDIVSTQPQITTQRQFSYDLCPSGSTPLPNGLSAGRRCNPVIRVSCPPGYECLYAGRINDYICCSSGSSAAALTAGICPRFSSPIFIGGQPRTCSPEAVGSCPGGYLCTFNAMLKKYVCCSNTYQQGISTECPNNLPPYMVQGVVQSCSPGSESSSCPFGYSCIYGATSHKHICCPASTGQLGQPRINYMCPVGSRPFLTNGRVLECSPRTQDSCPPGFACLYGAMGKFSCCSTEGYINTGTNTYTTNQLLNVPPQDIGTLSNQGGVCPFNMTPLITHSGTPQRCNPGVESCPMGFSCLFAPYIGHYVCCTSAAIASNAAKAGSICPMDMVPLVVRGLVQACIPFIVNSCPSGYTCQYNPQTSTYACCTYMPISFNSDSVPGGNAFAQCPYSRRPLMENGQLRTCRPGNVAACPFGFNCETIGPGLSICCSSSTIVPLGTSGNLVAISSNRSANQCSLGARVLMTGGQVRECTPDFPSCPPGYTCLHSRRYRKFICCAAHLPSSGLTGNFNYFNGPVSFPSGPLIPNVNRAPGFGVFACPRGMVEVSPTGGVASCQARNPYSCPPGSLCMYGSSVDALFAAEVAEVYNSSHNTTG